MLLCVAPSNKFILSSAWSMWNVYYLKTTTVSLSMSMSIALTGPLPLFVVFFCRLVKRLIASTSSIVQNGSEHNFRIWWLLKTAEQLSETVTQWDSWIFAVFFCFLQMFWMYVAYINLVMVNDAKIYKMKKISTKKQQSKDLSRILFLMCVKLLRHCV